MSRFRSEKKREALNLGFFVAVAADYPAYLESTSRPFTSAALIALAAVKGREGPNEPSRAPQGVFFRDQRNCRCRVAGWMLRCRVSNSTTSSDPITPLFGASTLFFLPLVGKRESGGFPGNGAPYGVGEFLENSPKNEALPRATSHQSLKRVPEGSAAYGVVPVRCGGGWSLIG